MVALAVSQLLEKNNIRDDAASCKQLEPIPANIEFFSTCQRMFRMILGFFLDKPAISCYISSAVSYQFSSQHKF